MNTLFHPTANCQITICLTQGVHPNKVSRGQFSLDVISCWFYREYSALRFAECIVRIGYPYR